PSGRIDTKENFQCRWTDDVPYLQDELCYCPNCVCHVERASVVDGFCDFCKPTRKEKPTEIPPEIHSLIPAELFVGQEQRRFSATIRQKAHVLRVVLHKKPHMPVRLLSLGFVKPKRVHSMTFFREDNDQPWMLVHS